MKNLATLAGGSVLLALAPASPTFAQDSFTFTAAQGPTGVTRSLALARPAWLEKTIDVNIKNERPADALKRIVKQAGKNLESVEVDEGLSDIRLSLSARGVKVASFGCLAALKRSSCSSQR